MNSVLLTGYISKESQVFNENVMKFTVATSSNVKVNDQWESKASFHQITAFGYHIKRSVSKGDLVSVECHLDYSNYEKDGQKIYQTSLILDNLEVLKRKESQQSAPAGSYANNREQEKKMLSLNRNKIQGEHTSNRNRIMLMAKIRYLSRSAK